MLNNFPEALDAVLTDGAYIRRAVWNGQKDKYIHKQASRLVTVEGEEYNPSQEDIFAEDWNIFGKGLLGTGNVKEKTFGKRNN